MEMSNLHISNENHMVINGYQAILHCLERKKKLGLKCYNYSVLDLLGTMSFKSVFFLHDVLSHIEHHLCRTDTDAP